MQLTRETVDGYVALVSGPNTDRGERARRVAERIEEDETYARRVRVACRDGDVVAAVSAHPWLPTQ